VTNFGENSEMKNNDNWQDGGGLGNSAGCWIALQLEKLTAVWFI